MLIIIAVVGLSLLALLVYFVVKKTNEIDTPVITGPVSTPVAEPDSEDNETDTPYVKPFGQTVRVAEAYEVTAEPPQKLRSSLTSAGERGIRSVSVKILIKNDTEQVLNAGTVRVNATFNGGATSNVWDTDKSVGMFVIEQIQPGQTGTAEFGFSLPEEAEGDLRVEVRVGMTTDIAVFFGRA
jgi:hypothetical protein